MSHKPIPMPVKKAEVKQAEEKPVVVKPTIPKKQPTIV